MIYGAHTPGSVTVETTEQACVWTSSQTGQKKSRAGGGGGVVQENLSVKGNRSCFMTQRKWVKIACVLKFETSEVWLLQRCHYFSKCSSDISNLSMLQIIRKMGGGGGINTTLSQDLLLSDRSFLLIGLSEINRTSCAEGLRSRTGGDEGALRLVQTALRSLSGAHPIYSLLVPPPTLLLWLFTISFKIT